MEQIAKYSIWQPILSHKAFKVFKIDLEIIRKELLLDCFYIGMNDTSDITLQGTGRNNPNGVVNCKSSFRNLLKPLLKPIFLI